MSPIERFTRDSASKYIWAVMTLVAIAGLAFAITRGGTALDEERAVAQDRAVRYVEEVLEPRLDGADLAGPLTGEASATLAGAVDRAILVDGRVSRVRIWSTDGTLLFSTDRSDSRGSNAGLNDAVLGQASRQGVLTRSNISDIGGQDDPERSLLRTYASLGTTAVAEIDQTDEGTLAVVRTEWRYYRILAGVFVLAFLVLTGLSLRDPIEPINAGVPFAASSIPAGFSLIDDERLHAVHEVYRLASERVSRLQEKLERSEEARRRLEGDIQRALSRAGTAPPAAVTPPAPATPEPTIVQVPESEVLETPLGDALTASPAGPLARASRDQKPPPVTSPKTKPAAEKPKRTPRRPKAKREAAPPAPQEAAPQRTPQAPEPAPAPAPAPAPEPRVAAMATTAAPAPPAPAPPSPVDPEVDDAEAHEAALETFIRLTESDRQEHETGDVDQGAVRAALARTAARKKPGGERLQSHERS